MDFVSEFCYISHWRRFESSTQEVQRPHQLLEWQTKRIQRPPRLSASVLIIARLFPDISYSFLAGYKCSEMSQATALLIVDMQNDFCLPNASLTVDGAMSCLPYVIQAVESARELKVPVIWVVREHDAQGGLFSLPAHWTESSVSTLPLPALVFGLSTLHHPCGLVMQHSLAVGNVQVWMSKSIVRPCTVKVVERASRAQMVPSW